MMPGRWYKLKLYPKFAYNDTNASGNWKIGAMGWRDVEYFNVSDPSVNQWSIVFEYASKQFAAKDTFVEYETNINISFRGVRNGSVYTVDADVPMRDDASKANSDVMLATMMKNAHTGLV